MALSLDIDELKTQIVSSLNVDSNIYFTQEYKVDIFDDDNDIISTNVMGNDMPYNVSDISHEHIITINVSKGQMDIFKNNHVDIFLCGHEKCGGYISIFKTSKPTIDFIDTLGKFNY